MGEGAQKVIHALIESAGVGLRLLLLTTVQAFYAADDIDATSSRYYVR